MVNFEYQVDLQKIHTGGGEHRNSAQKDPSQAKG